MSICFKVGGLRTRVELEEGKQIIQRLEQTARKKKNKTPAIAIIQLDLSCRAWPYETLVYFFENSRTLQQSISSIRILQIDDIIASLQTEEGLKCIEYISQLFGSSKVLTELHLCDNALGVRGIELLKPLLSLPSLKRIYLNNCGLSAEVGTILYTVLKPSVHNIQVLSLSRNQIGSAGCEAISKLLYNNQKEEEDDGASTATYCSSLEQLEYAGCRPLNDGTKALCFGLYNMVNAITSSGNICVLHTLNLDDCQINSGEEENDDGDDDDDTPSTIDYLCQAIEKCTLLRKLILRDCNLTCIGLTKIINALRISKAQLHYLDIGANEIGIDGIKVLCQYIIDTQLLSLQTIICDTNEIENNGFELFVSALCQCQFIQLINIQCNDITNIDSLLVSEFSSTLQTIDLQENNELTNYMIRQLNEKYSTVQILADDDLEDGDDDVDTDNDNDDDDDDNNDDNKSNLDDLINTMKQTHID